MATNNNDDCYFYYYSVCNKGESCGYRHEPAARAQEVVCTFWKQGKCSKPHCIYRHMELDKKRNVIPCFWEKQPSGCTKPHCPFLHEKPKEPYPEVEQNAEPSVPESTPPKIFVNKNKIHELKDQIILPEIDYAESFNRSSAGVRGKVSAKARLGTKPSIKDRLGFDQKIVRIVESGSESEEESLRRDAMQTLDLRHRLTRKDEYDPEFPAPIQSQIVVVKAKDKKLKKEKKLMKKFKEGTLTKKDLKKLKKLQKSKDIGGEESLAEKIAKQRDLQSTEDVRKSLKRRMEDPTEDESKKTKQTPTQDAQIVIADVDSLLSQSDILSPAKDGMDAVEQLEALLN